jgi:hypothetical protein
MCYSESVGTVISDARAKQTEVRAALLAAVGSLFAGDLDAAEAAIRRLAAVADEEFAVEVSMLEAWLLRARGRYGAAAARLEHASHRTLVDQRLADERRRAAAA